MLSFIMLSVVMLSVVMMSVVMLSVVMLSVVIPSVVTLNVSASTGTHVKVLIRSALHLTIERLHREFEELNILKICDATLRQY